MISPPRDRCGPWALFLGPQHHLAGSASRGRQVEQRLEAFLAAEPERRVRGFLRGLRIIERNGASRADVRLDHCLRACVGGRRRSGQESQAFGRSRGGFSPKIHLKTDLDGYPLGFNLTGGKAGDSRNFEALLDIGPDGDPRAAVADKGYDAKSNREVACKRGICPVIPYRSNTIDRPKFVAKLLYKSRARLEQMNGKLKRYRRIAPRCEKTARNYAPLLVLVCSLIAIKSVHTT